MLGTRLFQKVKVMALTASVVAMGALSGVGCSLNDIRDNVIAGSLDYVSDSANSFWANLLRADEFWAAILNPGA